MLRVAAISFVNPAPLLYNFEHEPAACTLRDYYALHYMTPAGCAAQMHAGTADLGLIPIAELTPELAVVPGCTIASLHQVRSILLLVKNGDHLQEAGALQRVRTLAADQSSRSSQAYVRLIFEHFYGMRPSFTEHAADPLVMLDAADAALLIGDPALLAREHRPEIDANAGVPLLWIDVAEWWRRHTGLPWVAAVWAVRPEALSSATISAEQLTQDLIASRNNGLAHIENLVREWAPKLPIPAATVRTYLTENIHYKLDLECLEAIRTFRKLAAETGGLPPLPQLNMLL